MQLLLQRLFNSTHFCAVLLRRPSEAVTLGNPWHLVCLLSLFGICQLKLLVNQYQSAGIFSSFEVHQFHRSTVCISVLFHYIPFSSFHLPCRISTSAWQKRLPTRDAYHRHQRSATTNRGDMVTDNTFGYKCVFSEIIRFYLLIYWKSTLYTCLSVDSKMLLLLKTNNQDAHSIE